MIVSIETSVTATILTVNSLLVFFLVVVVVVIIIIIIILLLLLRYYKLPCFLLCVCLFLAIVLTL
jgi:hypothetical protein